MKKNTTIARHARTVVILSAAALLAVSCSRPQQQPPEDPLKQAYQKEIDAWHHERIASLTKNYGWLTLTALTWLKDGKNDVASFGTITVKGGKPVVAIAPALNAVVAGKKFTAGIVKSDADKGAPDTVFIGTSAHILIKRGDKFALRSFDSASPARASFSGIDRYPVNDAWKIEARWEPYAAPKAVSIETVIPGFFDEGKATGVAVFSVGGKEYRLEPTVDDTGNDYFFVFADKTNGAETYGAGRFLHTGPPKDGKIVLDFNKATNPPCAFTEFATCPLPSSDNRLAARIEAGEKKFGHH